MLHDKLNPLACVGYFSVAAYGEFNSGVYKRREISAILDEIESNFEVSQREAREDFDGFVESLKRERILLANG